MTGLVTHLRERPELRPLKRVLAHAMWLVRPRFPWAIGQRLTRRRIARVQQNPMSREIARANMEHLVGADADGLDELTDEHLAFTVALEDLRWYPNRAVSQRVMGIEHVHAAAAQGRGVVLSFAHHAYFDGAFGAVARAGAPMTVLTAATSFENPGPNIIQDLRVIRRGGQMVSTRVGVAGVVEHLGLGELVAMAVDVPGTSVVEFGGRPMRCSSGGVRAAVMTGAPIVIMSAERDEQGPYVRLSPPIEPGDDVQAMLQHVVSELERSVMAWPAATFMPQLCWTPA